MIEKITTHDFSLDLQYSPNNSKYSTVLYFINCHKNIVVKGVKIFVTSTDGFMDSLIA